MMVIFSHDWWRLFMSEVYRHQIFTDSNLINTHISTCFKLSFEKTKVSTAKVPKLEHGSLIGTLKDAYSTPLNSLISSNRYFIWVVET